MFGVAVGPCYDMRCVVCYFFPVGELRCVTQNLLSDHRALYRTLHHQIGGGRNLKSWERGLPVVLHWLCTSGVVYACYAIIFCTCLCISKYGSLPLHVFESSFVWPAGVKISTSPVGVGVDSSLRLLAWGCRRSNPGGSRPSLHPPFVPSGGSAH